jgi:NADPH2:quinone reductase
VEVHAVGVNFTDLLAVEGRSQLKRDPPMIPGVEASGVVLGIGPGVNRIKPGQRVLGQKIHGACAEEVLFDEDELAVMPDEMGFQDAAAFYIAYFTTRYALQDRAKLAPEELLLVLGAGGGAGLAAVEIGKALGARVIAAASSDEKLALARARGADEVMRYDRGPLDIAGQKAFVADLLARAPRPNAKSPMGSHVVSTVHTDAGFDVIFDGVGGTYAEPALRTLAWQGRYLSVGFAAGMPKVALGPALFKNADIMGIQPSSDEHRLPGRCPAAMQQLFTWYREGKLRPQITQVLPLARTVDALRALQQRTATGRIVLTTPRARGD